MEKFKFEQGKYYEYENAKGYAFRTNKLVLDTGAIVYRTMNKYVPDKVHYGSKDRFGYRKIKIDNSTVLVHRLVATHFIDNPNNLPVVDHINENKEDNRVENLQWTTREHNTSRQNIREHRALNSAKDKLKEAKKLQKIAEDFYRSVEEEKEEINQLYAELEYKKKVIFDQMEEKIHKYETKVDKLCEIAESNVKRQEKAKANTIKKMWASRKDMIENIGNKIKVDNEVFPSVRSAARFIVSEERRKRGRIRNPETVRKELKKIQSGAREEGIMYDCYEISRLHPQ